MRAEYLSTLREGAESLGLELPEDWVEGLLTHQELVDKWSRKINLTSLYKPEEAAIRHALDSLLFTQVIEPDCELSTIDVGSGAGFPGIPVAIARPDLPLVLLEPIRKRASFMRVVLSELGLTSVRVEEGRLPEAKEAVAGRAARLFPVEQMISRATIPPLKLIECAGPRMAAGGRLILTSGQGAPSEEELAAAGQEAGLSFKKRHAFALPDGSSRVLDVLIAS